MAYTAQVVEYFYVTINAAAHEAYAVLDSLAALGVNFLALTAVPLGPDSTQLTLFPEDAPKLQAVGKKAGLVLTGAHPAVLVQGDDEIGVLAHILKVLAQENVDTFATTAVTDGKGRFGFILYVRPGHAEKAARAIAR